MDIITLLWWLFLFQAFSLVVNTLILIILASFYSRVKSYEYTRKVQDSAND